MPTPEPEVIRAGLDQDLNYIDTARIYMNGKNEEIRGPGDQGPAGQDFLATKPSPSRHKEDIVRDVEK